MSVKTSTVTKVVKDQVQRSLKPLEEIIDKSDNPLDVWQAKRVRGELNACLEYLGRIEGMINE